MTLTEFRAALRLHLKDSGSVWSDDELDRAVTHAIADVSRFSPREQVHEERLYKAVSSESWTAGASAGTYVALANAPIKYDSETVTDSSSNACTRGTDYYMDYWNGKITHISGGEIDNDEASCVISYEKDETTIDLSSLSDLIRVMRVEYPVGQVPSQKVNFDVFGAKLTVTGMPQTEQRKQQRMSDGNQVRVFYHSYHANPTAGADSASLPAYFDELVVKGSEAYCWLIEAAQYEHQAVTDFASARTALGNISHTNAETALTGAGTEIGLANAALDEIGVVAGTLHAAVTTALDAANTALDAAATPLSDVADSATPDYHALADTAFDAAATKLGGADTPLADVADGATPDYHALSDTALDAAATAAGNADTPIGNVADGQTPDYHALADTALDAANSELDEAVNDESGDFYNAVAANTQVELYAAGGSAPSVSKYLTDGDDYIPTVNVGDRVAEVYTKYADLAASLAAIYDRERSAYYTQAATRVQAAATFKTEADGRMNHIAQKLNEANARANQAQVYIAEGAGRMEQVTQKLNEVAAFVSQAQGYITEGGGRLDQIRTKISEATAYRDQASGYLEEATARLTQVQSKMQEANGRLSTAEQYVAQATQYLFQIDRLLSEADKFTTIASQNLELAVRYREMGQLRRNEYWAILASRSQSSLNRSSGRTD